MSKLSTTFLIFFLILFTAIIKNSTKRMDDEIFAIEENIRGLKKDLENIKLENDYLSSAEKLMEFQYLYFPDELVKKELKEIIIINKQFDKSEAKPLSIINE